MKANIIEKNQSRVVTVDVQNVKYGKECWDELELKKAKLKMPYYFVNES